MSEPLLTIANAHSEQCGRPPIVANDPGLYVGYFENVFGEQWLFTCDRKTKRAELRGGDTGWENAYEVRDGKVNGLVLSAAEALWVHVCWLEANPERP